MKIIKGKPRKISEAEIAGAMKAVFNSAAPSVYVAGLSAKGVLESFIKGKSHG